MANANETSPAEILQALRDLYDWVQIPPWERDPAKTEELDKRVVALLANATVEDQ